jgi:phage I-like protein
MQKRLIDLETRDLRGVEIMAPGTWNGDLYSSADLDAIVTAFDSLKAHVRPPGKLGHDDGQKLAQADGYPAIGWVEKVYRKGAALLADFIKVPARVADLIQAGAYNAISAEIYFDYTHGKTTYPRVLKAVSFLGGDMPAVKDIKSISDVALLYHEPDAESTVHLVRQSVEKEQIVNLKELAESLGLPETATEVEVMAKIAENKAKAEAEPKASVLTDDEARTLRDQVGALTKTLAERDANTSVDSAIQAGKLLPAQRPWAVSYALSDPAGFKSYVESAPRSAVVRTLGTSEGDDEDTQRKTLSEGELAVRQQLGSFAPSDASMLRAKSGTSTVSLIERK